MFVLIMVYGRNMGKLFHMSCFFTCEEEEGGIECARIDFLNQLQIFIKVAQGDIPCSLLPSTVKNKYSSRSEFNKEK